MTTNISSQKDLQKLETNFIMENNGKRKTITLAALEFNHALSTSGKYLFVQLCNSKSEESGRFIKIDVTTGEKLYSVLPEWGWAKKYEFINDDGITVVTNNYGSYELDDKGNLVNRENYYMSRVKAADHGTMRALPEFFELHGKNERTYDLALESIDTFLETCFSMFHGLSWAASALKSKAEILGLREEYVNARQCCVDAISLDSRATVKRMLNTFNRKLNINTETLEASPWANKLKVSVEKVRADEINRVKQNNKKSNVRQDVIITKEKQKIGTKYEISVNRKTMISIGVLLIVVFFIWASK
ncbi:hypothetical protein [Serratia marcescens]|uniref:hypothetical protein n=1 Tax=Serratia marcescens TaxID=615 RepID=UPI003D77058C